MVEGLLGFVFYRREGVRRVDTVATKRGRYQANREVIVSRHSRKNKRRGDRSDVRSEGGRNRERWFVRREGD